MSKTKNHKWFLAGLLAVLIAAPNAAIVKYGVESVSPLVYNTLRFSIVTIITLPLLIRTRHHFTKRNVRYSVISGLAMTGAVFSFITAIKLSQASYVSILTLITPIVFVLMSNRVTGEKINRRSMLGLTLTMIGAMVIVLLPIAIRQSGDFVFYPMATLLSICNSIFFPIAIIYYKKANDDGVPIFTLMSFSTGVVAICSATALLFTYALNIVPVTKPDTPAIVAALYSGILVALIARSLGVKSYEHIGALRTSALTYLENFLAILVPIIFLGEKLSAEMILGGVLVLIGVYVVEHHKSVHHKHHHIFRNH